MLLGPLGFGKTFTIAYVVEFLRDGAFASNTPAGTGSTTAASVPQPGRNVCSYYFKDDGTTDQALKAFRSLLESFHSCAKTTSIYMIVGWKNRRKRESFLPLTPRA